MVAAASWLGHEDGCCMHWVPKRVRALHPSQWEGQRVAAISAGAEHSLAVLRDGRVLGWGAAGGVGLALEACTDHAGQPASWGSAGNHEWAPGDALRRWQVHAPTPLVLRRHAELGKRSTDPQNFLRRQGGEI